MTYERNKKLIHDVQRTLKQQLAIRKAKNTRYSLRAFAQSLKIDHSLLSKFLRGKKNLSLQQIVRVGRELEIREPWLILAKELHEGDKAAARVRGSGLMQRKVRNQLSLPRDQADFIANWYDTVILEIASLHRSSSSPDWISARLGHSVTPEQCADSLKRLQRLGLLKMNAKGWMVRVYPDTLVAEHEIPRESIRHYHRQVLHRAMQAVDSLSIEDRQLLACTVPLKTADLPKAQSIMRNALTKITKMSATADADEIFQVSNQFVRVTFQEGTPW